MEEDNTAKSNMKPYIGKDYIKKGYLVTLELESWDKISKKARWSIKKAESLGLKMVESKTTSKIKHLLFPKKIKKNQRCYYALDRKDKVIAGIVIEFSNRNILYQYAASKEEGKKAQANSFLIWNIVCKFSKTKYKYLDLGTSYRKELDHFKQQFACETYPTIYNPPRILPQIGLAAYTNFQEPVPNDAKNVEQLIKEFFGKEFTLLPDGRTAIHCILTKLSLSKNDIVTIITSFNTPYVAKDVTDKIRMFCKYSRRITKKTKIIYVIHEWGFPVENIEELREYAIKNNIILIEDCAHSITTTVNNKRIGTFGDYAIYSFPKVFPCQYGGMLLGISASDEEQKNLGIFDYEKREIVKKTLSRDLEKISDYATRRIRNYLYLDNGFRKIGFSPFRELPEGTIPHAYILNTDTPYKLAERLKLFGITVGVYHQSNAILVPVHQNLNDDDLDYILAVIKSHQF